MAELASASQRELQRVDILVSGLRASAGFTVSEPVPEDAGLLEEVGALAARAKVLPDFLDGLTGRVSKDVSDWRDRAHGEYRAAAFRTNAAMFSRMQAISGLLRNARIDYVCYKGPFQQYQLYGDPYRRPSQDIDILVARRDFKPAIRLLEQHGLKAHTGSLWWWQFLGQEHIYDPREPTWSIDLHHRLQEPGMEQPDEAGRFLESPEVIDLPGGALPVLRRDAIALVCAMNIVKGLSRRGDNMADVRHKLMVSHCVDLLHVLGGGTEAGAQSFVEAAARHRMEGSALVSLRVLSSLYGLEFPSLQPRMSNILPDLDDATLRQMVCAPSLIRDWPGPMDVLAGTSGTRRRDMVSNAAWFKLSEFVRKSRRARQLVLPKIS